MRKKIIAVCGVVIVLFLCGLVLGKSGVFAADEPANPWENPVHQDSNSVSSSVSADASVTVPTACSFSRTSGTGEYSNALMNNSNSEITGSTFTTICNDGGGYAIYAVGYSNNTLGNTDLIFDNTPSSANNIHTDGSGSNWGMSLSTTVPNKPVIESGFSDSQNPHTIPNTYTKVASYNTVATEISSNEQIGQSLTTHYYAYASAAQPAGTYTGAVKYTMVHPNTNIPNQPQNCAANKICYFPNAGNTVADTMGDQSITSSDTSATLWASNFQRPGYGFAGWSDAYDYVVNVGSGSNSSAHIYGPNEDIEFTAGQYSGTDGGLALYAVWVPVATDASGNELTFQTVNLLTTNLKDGGTLGGQANGYVTALRDERDNQVYAVAKLADGNYWMTENLRLNNNSTTPNWGDNSLSQGFGGVFRGLADAESGNFSSSSSTTANSLYNTGNAYTMPRYNNNNTNSPIANMTGVNNNIYSYGNHYTWAAALANTNDYTGPEVQVDGKTSETANTSICPSGWRLPYGQNTGNGTASGGFYNLNYKINNDSNVTDATAGRNLRAYPNNFVYSGRFLDSSAYIRGGRGYYWSSTAYNSYLAYYLYFDSSVVDPGTGAYKYGGSSVRCVLGS